MTKIILTEDLKTGVAKIDEQHQELIDRINELKTMGSQVFSKEEIQKTLDLLGEYVIKHFADEEQLQNQNNYPKYEMHKELHKNFVKEFLKMQEEFASNGSSLKFSLELTQVVINWLIKHIKMADVEFGRYYKELNTKN